MKAKIEGKLIKPAREVVHGFIFAQELWMWIYEQFPKFAGKRVEIIIRELEGEDGQTS